MLNLYDPKKTSIKHLNTKNFKFVDDNTYLNLGKNTPKNAFIIIYAPWCGHCKSQEELWMSIHRQFQLTYPVYVVNGDNPKNFKLMDQLNVEYFPSVFRLSDEHKLERYTYEINYESIQMYIWSSK